MKKHFIHITGIVITIIITLFLVQCTGKILRPKNSLAGFEAIKSFHLLEDNSLEVIVYGSSHAWKGFDTRILCDNYGLAAYNYGCNWQRINTTELFIKDSLRTQAPKVAFIETGKVDQVLKDTNMNGEIYYTKAMDNFDSKKEYLKQCFGNDAERYASYYFPLIMFHDNWNEISRDSFRKQNNKIMLDTAGFRPSEEVYQCVLPNIKQFEQKELPDDAISILDEIVYSLNKKGIRIIFYTCPYIGQFYYSNALKEYAENNKCEYIDLFQHYEDVGFDGDTDFQDKGHLNNTGAAKVADYLARYYLGILDD